MKNIIKNSIFKALVLLAVPFVISVAHAAPPSFVQGEVVVKGEAWEFTDYDVLKELPHSGYVVLKVTPGKEMAQLRRLRDKGKKTSLNFIVNKFATANDPFFSPYQWHLSAVQAEAAWDITTGVSATTGTGVIVAALDTGFSTGGNDGVECIVAGKNIIDGSITVADGNGHGTHVSGTIAQRTNNGIGVAGLAHGACVMPVKVLNDEGSGSDADVAEGIAWAIANGARVINMSLGYPSTYSLADFAGSASYNVLNNASDTVSIVVASGNDGTTGGVSYPASHPNTIAVGATGFDNSIAPYSNQGNDLDLVAPGGNTGVDLNGDGYGDGVLQETASGGAFNYYFYQGTSMAAPHVAAAAALIVSQNNSFDRAQVLNALKAGATDLGSAGEDAIFGAGLLQVSNALAGFNPPVNQTPIASFTFDCDTSFYCSFDSTSTDDVSISSYHWAFGDGATDDTSGENVGHQYNASGDYTVVLTVTDGDGASSTTSDVITLVGSEPTETPVVSLTDNANGTATIDWWNYSDLAATGFDIERRKQNTRNGKWSGASLIASVPSEVTEYVDSSGSGTFGYRVRAKNASGASPWSTWTEISVSGGGSSKGGDKKGGGKPRR